MMKHAVLALFVAVVTTASSSSTSYALNTETHRLINEAAANQSGLDTFLKTQLGLLSGVNEVFKGLKVFEWIAEGGVREDDGLRFFRHFHDPLQPWASAGLLDPLCLGRCDSSIRWMQRNDQDWSWQRARTFFFNALTSSSKESRDQAFADSLRGLGQVMHLVVDASVPEHVRNDIHPMESICRTIFRVSCYGSYEYWVSDNISSVRGSFDFDSAILRQPTGDSLARIPIARLIDTDTYTGLSSGPDVTLGSAIGIAEFANANFFSEDTGNRSYPFPNFDTLVPSQHLAPKTGTVRAYFAKRPGDGLPVDPVLAECVLYEPAVAEGISDPIVRTCTDENVWERVAEAMLPRAVGYARGVLDYFFRGRLDVQLVELGSINASPDPLAPGAAEVRVKVKNVTPDEEAGTGQIVAVASRDGEVLAVSAEQTVTLTRTAQELVFDFKQNPMAGGPRLFLQVVYRGPLGLEEEAVVVGGTPLFVPVVVTGDQAPEGGTFRSIDSFSTNNRGAIAFSARTANSEGIYLASNGMIQRVVEPGDAIIVPELLLSGVLNKKEPWEFDPSVTKYEFSDGHQFFCRQAGSVGFNLSAPLINDSGDIVFRSGTSALLFSEGTVTDLFGCPGLRHLLMDLNPEDFTGNIVLAWVSALSNTGLIALKVVG